MKKTRRFLWALLPMAVALIFASCSSNEDVTEPTPATGTKTVPVKITVGMNDATRATVGSDNSTLSFQSTDKLAVLYGGSLLGELSITENSGTSATFAGEVTTSGSTTSYSGATVVLVSSANAGVQTTTDYSWVNSGTAICVADGSSSALNEAVKQFSYLTATGTFNLEGENSFTLTQHTAFLNIVVTFEDGTAANTDLSVIVTNNSSTIGTGTVTTATVGNDVVAQFVVPVAANTTLSGATIAFTGKDPITLSSTATLAGQSYRIEKTISGSSAPAGVVAVDLGLPSGTKWANMNVGATSPEGYGDYFAWGETTGYEGTYNDEVDDYIDHNFNWENYKWYSFGDVETFTRYVDYYSDYSVLLAEDDAATANWGSAWKMPTEAQWVELGEQYPYSATSGSKRMCLTYDYNSTGVAGLAFYDESDNILLFLPAAGWCHFTGLFDRGTKGEYWSSEFDGDYAIYAWCIVFEPGCWNVPGNAGIRCLGYSVRPVLAQ